MQIKTITPVIAVKDIARSRIFYEETLGFETVRQNGWYVHMRAPGNGNAEIGFLASHHPSQPQPFQTLYNGQGLFLTVAVDDVDAEHQRLQEKGITIKVETRNEPWGERHFAIEDPNGVILNISRTDPTQAGKVSTTEQMMQKDKGVPA